ncbi:MAG: carbonic anhydrase family protein [Acaryochloridaceae cyanobacterium CSU_3_4]|nr:carbonic anhydrase family protein [Acaryochloridaceae cyanobacterium CSU_3_4]
MDRLVRQTLSYLTSILFAVVFLLAIIHPTLAASQQDVNTARQWGYEGVTDPSHWADLEADFALCSTGQSQSPINLRSEAAIAHNETLNIDYHPSPFNAVNTGRTLQMNYASGSQISLDNENYKLVQFHFHAPSEHLIESKASEMELHLVHKNANNQLAVIGIMIEPGSPNETLEELWDHIPTMGTKQSLDLPVDASQLLPDDLSFYHYQGSLTTPPCSESVNWVVMKHPIQASSPQIETFKSYFHTNARPLQALHDRAVQFSQ